MKQIYNYFSKGNDRSQKAKKNIVASFIIKGVSILTSLVMVPLTLGYVNSTQYGIWLTMSSILSWFSFFDMGFSHGFRNKCAEALAQSDIRLAKSYVSTTYMSFVIIFSSVFCIFFIVNRFLNWGFILGIPQDTGENVKVVFDVVAFFFCFHIVLGVINALLLADQKPAFSSFLTTLGQVIILGVIFILTKLTEGSLMNLAAVMSVVPVIVLLISSFVLFNSRYKQIKPSIKFFDSHFVKDILLLGSKFFVIQIALIFTFQALNVIISHTQGPEQVTVYNVTYKCFYAFNMLFGIIISPFWSATTDAYTKGDFVWVKNSYRRLVKISVIFVIGILAFLLISDYVYAIWLKGAIEIPFRISLGMAIYICLTTMGCVPVNFLNGMGKVKIQMYIQIFFAIITIPGLLLILKHHDLFFGLLFVSLNPLIHIIICNLQLNKVLNNKARNIWNA